MTWDYLNYENFIIRYDMAAKLLGEAGRVVELNCGKQYPLLDKLIGLKSYYGNDVLAQSNMLNKNKIIVGIEDEKVFHKVKTKKIDSLILLGDGAGKYTNEPEESSTSLDSFIKIADAKRPKKILYETVLKFEEEYKIISQLDGALSSLGYIKKIELDLRIYPFNTFVHHRRFCLYNV